MARVFLDANFFIDIIERRKEVNIGDLSGHSLFISPLSIHILLYVYKYKLPNPALSRFLKFFNIVPFERTVVEKSLDGPTNDFEDNLQLHSAAQSNCDFLLTHDKNLLKYKFFGKMAITEKI